MRNRMLKGKRVRIAILALGLAAVLLFTACAPASTVPVEEEKVVNVAAVWPLTGPAAASCQLCQMGIQDYFTYFNEQEAIPGVSIKLLWGDTMMQYAQFRSHYEKFVEHGIPLMFANEASGLLGLESRFEQDGVVMLMPESSHEKTNYPPGWRYCVSPTTAEQFAVVAEYFRENWQEERPPRLAFMVIDSPFGYDPTGEGTKYAQSLGFEVLPLEIVPFVTLDATTQLLRLRESEADLVYIQALPMSSGPVLRDAERLGLVGQMQFAGHSATMSDRVIQMAEIASEGFLTPRKAPWFDETEISGVKLILDNQMKYHGKVQREAEYFPGWIAGAVACEAIRRAVENVGYENLDGLAIKEALDSIKDFDVYGLATVTYKPGDHRGNTKVAIYEVRDGKIVRVSDWQEAPMLVPGE